MFQLHSGLHQDIQSLAEIYSFFHYYCSLNKPGFLILVWQGQCLVET